MFQTTNQLVYPHVISHSIPIKFMGWWLDSVNSPGPGLVPQELSRRTVGTSYFWCSDVHPSLVGGFSPYPSETWWSEFVSWDYFSIPNCFWKVIQNSIWFQLYHQAVFNIFALQLPGSLKFEQHEHWMNLSWRCPFFRVEVLPSCTSDHGRPQAIMAAMSHDHSQRAVWQSLGLHLQGFAVGESYLLMETQTEKNLDSLTLCWTNIAIENGHL